VDEEPGTENWPQAQAQYATNRWT